MAQAKRRKKKKKNRSAVGIVLCILLIIAIVIGTYAFINHDKIIDKAKELTPSFSYPTQYQELVVKYSKKYSVDATLIYSVINVESHFDTNAKSDVGALGLMQIMPDAYDWIKFRLNDKKATSFAKDMVNKEKNIQYGSYYLSYLMNKYDNSIELTAAAYHCGMTTVDNWLKKKIISKDNFNVSSIPDENDATAYYVEKITTSYENYKKILSSNADLSSN